MRPTRRMPFSSSSLRTLPTGAFVFWRDSAFVTSLTDTLYSRSFCACSSTDNSRLSEPFTVTLATPSMARRRSASLSSARREISAWLWLLDDSARFMIGWADGSTRCRIGSRISTGSFQRTPAMALRTSSDASIRLRLKSNCSTIVALPSFAYELISVTPVIACIGFSRRSSSSRSLVSGDAPGYGMLTTMIGMSTSGFWFTRSLESASRPMHIMPMISTTVAMGFLTLKLERNIGSSPVYLAGAALPAALAILAADSSTFWPSFRLEFG